MLIKSSKTHQLCTINYGQRTLYFINKSDIITHVRVSFIWVKFIFFLGGYAFMGALIIKEVVKELLLKGLDKAKVLLLAGVR